MKILVLLLALYSSLAVASPTKVGNGDDGADLEDLQLIKGGMLISTRDKALKLVQDLNLKGIKGLGYLADELKHGEIYLSKSEIKLPKDFDKGMESSEDGKNVYARTIARPYSSVRFFPSALTLSEEQMIRLHIHEALHRALPEHIRENESIVADITLAITAPNASKDGVEQVVMRYAPSIPTYTGVSKATVIKEDPPYVRMMKSSKVKATSWSVPSLFYDFNKDNNHLQKVEGSLSFFEDTLEVGFSAFVLGITHFSGAVGPGELSAKGLLTKWKGFEITVGASYASNLVRQNSELFRDINKMQVSMRREQEELFYEMSVSYTLSSELPGAWTQYGEFESVKYAPVTAFEVSGGKRLGNILVSSEMSYLNSRGNSLKVAPEYYGYLPDNRGFYLLALRPEVGYLWKKSLHASIFAMLVLDGTEGYNFTDLGDVGTWGYGDKSWGVSVAYHF